MPDYTVIIPAYNEAAFLPATFAALHEAMAAVPEFTGEIVVCDNHSTDATAAIARDQGARVVFEPHNQISRARNTGARAAASPFLLFLDADTQLPAVVLRGALEALATGRVAGGGSLVRFDRRIGFGPTAFLMLWTWLSRTFKWACGACVWCRRDAWEEVGGFDERFYASEEIHFSNALKRWARRHDMEVRILDGPIVSSARKMEWFTVWQMIRMSVPLLWPWSLRRQDRCPMWYVRPLDKPAADSTVSPEHQHDAEDPHART